MQRGGRKWIICKETFPGISRHVEFNTYKYDFSKKQTCCFPRKSRPKAALHMHSPNKGVINKMKPRNKISEKTLKNGQNKLYFRF